MATRRSSTVRSLAFATVLLLPLSWLTGCGLVEGPPTEFRHINLAGQLDKFSQDFNARSDQVRLVFIVGPT